MVVLWISILMTITSIILYLVGAIQGTMGGLWIASVVIGGISAIMLSIAGHSFAGGVRMAAMACLVVQAVFITIMGTTYFGSLDTPSAAL